MTFKDKEPLKVKWAKDKGIVISIVVTKRLDGTIKHEVLLCHDFVNGIINEEENILFVA